MAEYIKNKNALLVLDSFPANRRLRILNLAGSSQKKSSKNNYNSNILLNNYNEFLTLVTQEQEKDLIKDLTFQKFLSVSIAGFFDANDYKKVIEIYEKIKDFRDIKKFIGTNLINVGFSYLILDKNKEAYELYEYIAKNASTKNIIPFNCSTLLINLMIASYRYKGIEATRDIYKEIIWHYGLIEKPENTIFAKRLKLEYTHKIFYNMITMLEGDNCNYGEVLKVYQDAVEISKIFKNSKEKLKFSPSFFQKIMKIANENGDYARVIEIYDEAKNNSVEDDMEIYANLMTATNMTRDYNRTIRIYQDIISRNEGREMRKTREKNEVREKITKAKENVYSTNPQRILQQELDKKLEEIEKKYLDEEKRLKYNMQFFNEAIAAYNIKREYLNAVSVYKKAYNFNFEVIADNNMKNKARESKLFESIFNRYKSAEARLEEEREKARKKSMAKKRPEENSDTSKAFINKPKAIGSNSRFQDMLREQEQQKSPKNNNTPSFQ